MSALEQPGCKGFATANAVFFECNRGMKPKVRCSSCGSIAAVSCDYPLSGEKIGQVCGRPLCGKCDAGKGENLCGPHARLIDKRFRRLVL